MMVKRFVFMIAAFAAVGLLGAAFSQQIIGINSADELKKLPKEIEWTGGPIQPPMPAQAPAQSVTSPLPKPFSGRPLDGGPAGTIGGQAIKAKDLHVVRATGKMFPRPTSRINDYVKGQLVIGFKTGMRGKYNCSLTKDGVLKTGIKSIDALNAKYGAKGVKNIHEHLFPEAYTYGLDLHHVFYVDPTLDLEAVAREYRNDPSVQFAHPDYIPMVKCLTQAPWAQTGVYSPDQVAPSYPNDPMFDWAPSILQVPRARTVTGAYGTGDGTGGAHPDTFLMLDTDPIDIRHEEFANGRIGDYNTSGTAADYHGHMCAAHAIGAMNNNLGICGVAGGNGTTPGILVAYYRYTSSSNNATGISWGVARGVASIAQASLYFADTQVLEAAFAAALAAGAPAYISAGNDRNTESNMFPAYYDCVTAVGGIDWYGRHWAWDDSSGSCYGDWVDIVAPGDAHWSANSGADDAYVDGYGGTSWAAPEVAAIAAVCHHVTGLTGTALQNAVLRTANSNDHLNAALNGWTIPAGAGGTGIANAYEAVTACDRNASVDFISANSANNNYLNHGDMYLQSYMQPSYDRRDTLFYNEAMYQSKMRQTERTIVPDVTIYPKAMVHNHGIAQNSFNVTATNGSGYTSTKTVTLGSGKGTLVTFDGWTPTGTGAEVLTVYSDLTGDGNRLNDTVKLNLTKALRDTVYMDDGSFDAGYTDQYAKWLVRFVPERTCTLRAIQWLAKVKNTVGGAPSAAACSILVYSDNNGKPAQKLYAQGMAWTSPPIADCWNVWTTTSLSTPQVVSGPVHIGLYTLGVDGDTLTIGFDYRKGSAVTHFSTDNGATWSELGNDMALRPVVGYRALDANDLCVDVVTDPSGQLTKGFGYTPKAVVKNFGSNSFTGDVLCHIDSVAGANRYEKYTSTKTVTALAPGASQTIEFDPYVPGGSGTVTYTVDVTVRRNTGTDAITQNDSIRTPLLTVALGAQLYYGVGTLAYYSPDGYAYLVRFNATAAGQVTSVGAVYYPSGASPCTAYVFSDNNGTPGTELGRMVATPNVYYPSWYTFTFPTPVNIPAGYFWAGVRACDGVVNCGLLSDDGATPLATTKSSMDMSTWYTETYNFMIRCDIQYATSPDNDLGVTSLDAPSSVVYKDFSVTPKATVKNGGKTALSGINVVCVTRDAYNQALIDSSTSTVSSLNPNQSLQLSFTPITPSVDSITMKVKRIGTDDASTNDSLMKKIYTSQLTEIDYSGSPSKLWIIDAADNTYDTLYRAVRFSPEMPCSLVGMWHFIYRTQTTQAWRACSTFAWDRTEGTKNWPSDRVFMSQQYTPTFTAYGGWVRHDITPTYVPSGRDFWLGAWTPPLVSAQCSIYVTTDYWADAGRSFIRWNPRDSASNGDNYVWLPMIGDWNISALVKYLGGPSRTVNGLVNSVSSEDSLSFRTYLTKNTDQLLDGNLSGGSISLLSGGQAMWQFDAKHFWPMWNRGDTMVAIFDQEINSGTETHAGYYAVMADTLQIDVASQTMSTPTMRPIPTPWWDNYTGSTVDLHWDVPTFDASLTGFNPLAGYQVWYSDVGSPTWTQVAEYDVSSGDNFLMGAPVKADPFYFAIKLLYYGSALSKGGSPKAVVISSKYLSANATDGPTAVTFANMSALVSGNDVTLKWRTESEQNSYQWLVERSDDGGQYYSQIGTVPARGNSTVPTDYSYQDNNLAGGKVFFYRLGEQDLNGAVTYYGPISVGPLAGRPAFYALGQAQPNPFNRIASISYQLKEPGRVTVRVYSITGQLIRTLVDAHQEADYYTATWDGTNNSGQKVAAGVYLYRMDVNGFSDMKKTLYIR